MYATFGGVARDAFPVNPQAAERGPRRAAPSATRSLCQPSRRAWTAARRAEMALASTSRSIRS